MPDIKTKDVVKGTIKKIDKAAVASQRMKQAYISTKDKAEHSVQPAESSETEYASNKVENTADVVVHETAHRADRMWGSEKPARSKRSGGRSEPWRWGQVVRETRKNVVEAGQSGKKCLLCMRSKSIPILIIHRKLPLWMIPRNSSCQIYSGK